MFAGHYQYSRQTSEFSDRRRLYRPWQSILGAVVILAVALAIAWSYIEGRFHHDDVTATIVNCSWKPGTSAPLLIYILDVQLTNTTGSARTVIPEDDQGHWLIGLGSGSDQPDRITLAPHDTNLGEYFVYEGDPLSGCSGLKIQAVPAGRG